MTISFVHFSNPLWFLALIPLLLVWFFLLRNNTTKSHWAAVCDPHLLPHLLESQTNKQGVRLSLYLLALAWLLAVFSLAEPAWSKVVQPVYQQKTARVFLLDLSDSMLATDLPPSRLDRAKFKLLDMLRAIKEGQTALVVYTREPFLVSPLTEDSHIIASMVPNLSPDIMPVQGNDLAAAIDMADDLFKQAHFKYGEIIVLTDSAPNSVAISRAAALKDDGITLSVLGVGTSQPVPLRNSEGDFVMDAQGQVKTTKLPSMALSALAQQGGGVYLPFSNSNTDITRLLAEQHGSVYQQQKNRVLSYWQVQGRWLLIVIAGLFLLVFRRGFRV
ncbi:MAG: hypothetical protein A3F17_04535 [Gammaproteobacteria bacterium RIFCSPHIGHO2_12_FULL_41_15]|nr:MAG: hypothetical protein A3F17_04535 [Gammaproteobacteria bacterium RIFCSPHIGHO2_12_FULL_41_15]